MDKLSRRQFIKASLVVLSGPALVACAGAPPASPPAGQASSASTAAPGAAAQATSAPALAAQPTAGAAPSGSIRFLASRLAEPVPGKLIKDLTASFMAEYPNIKVELDSVANANYVQKFTTQMAAGAGPDVIEYGTPDFPNFAKLSFLADHSKLVANEGGEKFTQIWDKKNFDLCRSADGKLLGLPIWTSVQAMIYNEGWFRDAGLDPDKPPKTYAEFTSDAKTLTRDTNGDGKPDQWGIGLYGMQNELAVRYLNVWFWNNGASIYNDDMTKATLNDEKGLEAWIWYTGLVDQGLVCPTFMTNSPQDIYKDWSNQKVAMFISGPWVRATVRGSLPEMEKNLRATVAPNNGKPGPVPTGGITIYGLSAQVKNEAASWEYLKFMTRKENMVNYCVASDYVPVVAGAVDLPVYKQDQWMRSFVELMPNSKLVLTHPRQNDLMLIIVDALQSVWTHKKAPKQAADDAAAALDKVLAEKV